MKFNEMKKLNESYSYMDIEDDLSSVKDMIDRAIRLANKNDKKVKQAVNQILGSIENINDDIKSAKL